MYDWRRNGVLGVPTCGGRPETEDKEGEERRRYAPHSGKSAVQAHFYPLQKLLKSGSFPAFGNFQILAYFSALFHNFRAAIFRKLEKISDVFATFQNPNGACGKFFYGLRVICGRAIEFVADF